jgi:hypothetical protein
MVVYITTITGQIAIRIDYAVVVKTSICNTLIIILIQEFVICYHL